MPFKSEKQRRLFEMIAHGGKPRSGKGPSQAVAKKFIADTHESGNPAIDEKPMKRMHAKMFGKGPMAMASHHPKASGKRKAR